MTLWQGAHSETKYLQSSSLTEPHCHPSQTQKSVFFFFSSSLAEIGIPGSESDLVLQNDL